MILRLNSGALEPRRIKLCLDIGWAEFLVVLKRFEVNALAILAEDIGSVDPSSLELARAEP